MFVVVNRFFLRKGFSGITLWPFIILKYPSLKSNPVFLNHERIHSRQQAEMLVILFYVWYGIEFLIRIFQYKNRHLAYRNISFEREAYSNEQNLTYLDKRNFWKFLSYI